MKSESARTNLAIFWISLLGLYLELLLIRWIGTEIRIFAYLQNTVLVVCFLGLGIGLFTSRRTISAQRGLLALVILATVLAVPLSRGALAQTSHYLSVLGEINIWRAGMADTGTDVVLGLIVGLLLTFALMVLILEPFIPIGRLLGRLLDEHPRPIVAYSINVVGSLAGIWLFAGLSRLSQPPVAWFILLVLLVLPFLLACRPREWLALLLLASTVPLVYVPQLTSPAAKTVWSPYQKLELFSLDEPRTDGSPAPVFLVQVNNVGYQEILDFGASERDSEDRGQSDPRPRLTRYDVPPLLHPAPARVLVVGSGTGNDVEGLLRHGAEHVTAVDIDPEILSMGETFHPQKPYDSERVETVNTDARSFFARTNESYDLIVFGLLDSHTTTSLTNARLDHYVYTKESFTRVKNLLNEGGVLTVTFVALRPFIADRLAVELREVFEEEPLAFNLETYSDGVYSVLFVAGDVETARTRVSSEPELGILREISAGRPLKPSYTTPPATDDWPYLYLDHPRIPLLFVLLAGLLGLLVFYAERTLDLPPTMNPRRWDRDAWHFFCLGAAFLLLEVQNISKASVVLGNTWLVNAVIITGVLAMVLIANAIVIRWPRIPVAPVFGVLIATVLALYFVDLARFAFMDPIPKAVLVGGLTTLPMVFSGIVFARAFAVATHKDHALGANLLGALLGAILQSLSFLIGIKALLLVVAAFYVAAMLTRPGAERLEAREIEAVRA
ncbi:MAG: methyltransferase domain-containing protein [Gemmatimonadetes bacterium]|nr:methyltransferase domain-containing protein [Gemmatimonadota bacterium]